MVDLLGKEKPIIREYSSGAGTTDMILFYLSFGVFLVILSSYGGLLFLNRSQTKTQLELLDQAKQKETNLKKDLDQIFTLERKTKVIRDLLGNHVFVSHILNLLEADTHPRVQFHDFTFNKDDGFAHMTGIAQNFVVLARQINTFERDKNIEKTVFGGLSIDDKGLATFDLKLYFKPLLLEVKPK